MKISPPIYHYIVSGRVQGVAFRHYTLHTANENNIRGTVKNLFNGDVEVYAQGEPEDLEAFEAFLHTGPPAARVTHVTKSESSLDFQFNGFDVIY